MHSLFHRNDGKTGFLLTAGAAKAALPTVIQRSIITLHGKLIMENDGSVLKRTFDWIPAFEAVQKSSLGYAGGKLNPLNPPYQGDFPLNSPLIRGARGVKNDERWVSCTVSQVGNPLFTKAIPQSPVGLMGSRGVNNWQSHCRFDRWLRRGQSGIVSCRRQSV